ncbi:unnamed protein product [Timema podura]|uniref:RBR-type E3 ubiquitin transferase n=1 Tax=Timema podura TaxID=61482 RepID=A0ABN7NJF8_TIMPD|nr:unnamed protein product [Timema podura]
MLYSRPIAALENVQPVQVKSLVSPELFAKYDAVLLSAMLDTLTGIVYCPRRSCQYPVIQEPEENMATCPECRYTFCVLCKKVYHGVAPCAMRTDERAKLVAEYQVASSEEKVLLEQRYGKTQLQNLVSTSMSETWIHDNSRSCPHCNAAIEKSEGCNKMVCQRCNTMFCWLCSLRLDQFNPYRHFSNPSSPCYNLLFLGTILMEDNDDIDFDDDPITNPRLLPRYLIHHDICIRTIVTVHWAAKTNESMAAALSDSP